MIIDKFGEGGELCHIPNIMAMIIRNVSSHKYDYDNTRNVT